MADVSATPEQTAAPSPPVEAPSETEPLKLLVNGSTAADLEMADSDAGAERADIPALPAITTTNPSTSQAFTAAGVSPPASTDTQPNGAPAAAAATTTDTAPAAPSTSSPASTQTPSLSAPASTLAPASAPAAPQTTTNTRASTPAPGAATAAPLPPSAIIPPAHGHGSSTRAYINKTVTPHLLDGMKWVAANE